MSSQNVGEFFQWVDAGGKRLLPPLGEESPCFFGFGTVPKLSQVFLEDVVCGEGPVDGKKSSKPLFCILGEVLPRLEEQVACFP